MWSKKVVGQITLWRRSTEHPSAVIICVCIINNADMFELHQIKRTRGMHHNECCRLLAP